MNHVDRTQPQPAKFALQPSHLHMCCAPWRVACSRRHSRRHRAAVLGRTLLPDEVAACSQSHASISARACRGCDDTLLVQCFWHAIESSGNPKP